MWKKPTKINVNATSLVELKAELSRKKEAFQQEEQQKQGSSSIGRKPSALAASKHWQAQKHTNHATTDAQKTGQMTEKEQEKLAVSQQMLEKKAELYDRMKQGDMQFLDEAKERDKDNVLVDFIRKQYQEESTDMVGKNKRKRKADEKDTIDDPWVEHVDEFGRTRMLRQSELKALDAEEGRTASERIMAEKRRQWDLEYEAKLAAPVGPIHYDESKEIRTKGTGYFKLSLDAAERQRQMQRLNDLRQQTVENRARAAQVQEKRKQKVEARLKKVKERRDRLKRQQLANEQEGQEASREGVLEEDKQ